MKDFIDIFFWFIPSVIRVDFSVTRMSLVIGYVVLSYLVVLCMIRSEQDKSKPVSHDEYTGSVVIFVASPASLIIYAICLCCSGIAWVVGNALGLNRTKSS